MKGQSGKIIFIEGKYPVYRIILTPRCHSHLQVRIFELYDRIFWRIWNRIQIYFSLFENKTPFNKQYCIGTRTRWLAPKVEHAVSFAESHCYCNWVSHLLNNNSKDVHTTGQDIRISQFHARFFSQLFFYFKCSLPFLLSHLFKIHFANHYIYILNVRVDDMTNIKKLLLPNFWLTTKFFFRYK